jgi:tetratricopeptide (TPR) repeat protein
LATARRLHDDGRLEAAHDLLARILAARPQDARVAFACARVQEALGRERAAAALYERALAGHLPRAERRSALIGLGSTARALGEYRQSLAALQQGREEFPTCRAMTVFLAMTLYNLGDHRSATEHLLLTVAETTQDRLLRRYRPALTFYASRLGAVWS